jgi:hypothetical protein
MVTVVSGRAAVLAGKLKALNTFAGDEVHDAANCVRAVDGARAFFQHVDVINDVDRNLIDIRRAA